MVQKDQPRRKYPSDLTDEQWAIVGPMIPPAKQSPRGGRPRKVNMREVLNTLFYLNRSGCQWDMLPHDVLPKSTVYDYVVQWRDDGTWAKMVKVLRERTRVAAGRAPTPSAVSWPAPSVRLRLCWPASPASASSMFIGFFTKSQLRGSLAPVASSSFDLVAIRKAPRRTHPASLQIHITSPVWPPPTAATKSDIPGLQSARSLARDPPSASGIAATQT